MVWETWKDNASKWSSLCVGRRGTAEGSRSWGWPGRQPQENAPRRVAHRHTITRLWSWSLTQSSVITPLREAKDGWKCFICLCSRVAVCLMNETDFIKCQGYLFVSNLEQAQHRPQRPQQRGFPGRPVGCQGSRPPESGQSKQKSWSAPRFHRQRMSLKSRSTTIIPTLREGYGATAYPTTFFHFCIFQQRLIWPECHRNTVS